MSWLGRLCSRMRTGSARQLSPDEIVRLQHGFMTVGLQYYVAGRVAQFNSLYPATGAFYHHGLVMLLKSLLLPLYSPQQLQSRFRHDLRKLWKAWKLQGQGQSLGRFDTLIRELDKWVELQYPNIQGLVPYFDRRNGSRSHAAGHRTVRVEEYRPNLEELDELVYSLLAGKVSPAFVKHSIAPFGEGIDSYEKENFHRLY
jgi:hypothetical protein